MPAATADRRRFVRPLREDTRTNAFRPDVLKAPDRTYLVGYWQFEDYFRDRADAIRAAFRFPGEGDGSRRLADDIRSTRAVSVHVRRGDYADIERLGFLDATYYRRAVEKIASSVPGLRAFAFSDDPAWCRANLALGVPTTVVERPLPPDRDWEDMSLMSICDHHVISNSTFGWWAAWLNPSATKLVAASSRWTLNERRAGDPVPAGWLRV